MGRVKKPDNNLYIFGLQVRDANGNPVGASDASGKKYYRNMVIEFVGRHFPNTLIDFYPEIRGPWLWGECADPAGFEEFLADNVAVKLQDDGSVIIYITSEVSETVYHPDKDQRARNP